MARAMLAAILALAAAACGDPAGSPPSDAAPADATREVAASEVGKSDTSIVDATADAGCTGGALPCPGCELVADHVDTTLGCVRGRVAVGCHDMNPASDLLSCVADATGELFVLSKLYPTPPGYRPCTKDETDRALTAASRPCETGG